jgi:hypothetical protein
MTHARELEGRAAPATWHNVQAQLSARLADELRVIHWAAGNGYLLPTMTLAASAFEIAYTMAFIGPNDIRAAAWPAHTKVDRTPWSIRTMVAEVAGASGKEAFAANAYGHYQVLCTGKHHNPVFTGAIPFATSGEAHIVEVDPTISPSRGGSLAIIVTFTLLHVAECLESLASTGVLSARTAASLPKGRLRWRAVAQSCISQRTPPVT